MRIASVIVNGKLSIAKLRFRNSDPDKMFRLLPQLNGWARSRNETGV